MNTIIFQLCHVLIYQFQTILYVLSFGIPFLFSSPQVITGTIINCLLFLSVYKLSNKESIPIVLFPSLGAIAHGVLFGPQTVFLYFFLPFIWIGNYVLVYLFSKLNRLPYAIRVIIPSIAKYMVLQTFSQLYFHNHIVPSVFVTSMGYIQLITAVLGGLLSYGIILTLSYERK